MIKIHFTCLFLIAYNRKYRIFTNDEIRRIGANDTNVTHFSEKNNDCHTRYL